MLKAQVLAGTDLPAVWIPSVPLRDDRELVRARLEIADKLARAKTQIPLLLKRNGIVRPQDMSSWTLWHWEWLNVLSYCEEVSGGRSLAEGTRRALLKLLREVGWLERERLDRSLERSSVQPRYAPQMRAQCEVRGVGWLTAVVFLTELGDVKRFQNRGQLESDTSHSCPCEVSPALQNEPARASVWFLCHPQASTENRGLASRG